MQLFRNIPRLNIWQIIGIILCLITIGKNMSRQ
jgi:hypothetical protein